MAEQTENMTNWLKAVDAVNECGNLLRVYEEGKVTFKTGSSMDITPAIIAELKQAFAAARNECKAALDAITAS